MVVNTGLFITICVFAVIGVLATLFMLFGIIGSIMLSGQISRETDKEQIGIEPNINSNKVAKE